MSKAFVITMAYVEDQPAYASITLLGQTAHYTRGAMDIGAGRDRRGPVIWRSGPRCSWPVITGAPHSTWVSRASRSR